MRGSAEPWGLGMVRLGIFRWENAVTGCAVPRSVAPETPQQVGNPEARGSSPRPAAEELADPRANHFVWFPHLERKKSKR